MQLNKFTDYALRILMYVARPSDVPYTIAEIAKDLHVSQNHLVKVVHFMGKQEWIITIRGKGGGIRLNPDALNSNLGSIVRILQGDNQIVECNTPPCVLRSHCGLKGILDQALESFYQSLDQYTLGEVLQQSKLAPAHSPIAFLEI
ncbi:Rrf2 family transcriptional regulator [Acinetobacter pittii]|uniref:RrF2 family transcriptional regulator n=1 Tax=Acinetobacter pittii TaxID=48296 RepID=UPI000CE3BDFD|nr:Rrf2 family transcriptional regulator [Acinetobacter pittii]PPC05608.1 transcriptional regulator [Acinetobacter pittii]WPP59783.1 Rrf2 family transcriptional regulator [Acinetobacter pittii]